MTSHFLEVNVTIIYHYSCYMFMYVIKTAR